MRRKYRITRLGFFFTLLLTANALANPDIEKLRQDLQSRDNSNVESALNAIVKGGGDPVLLDSLVDLGTNAQFLMLMSESHPKLVEAIKRLDVAPDKKYAAMLRIAATMAQDQNSLAVPIYRYLSAQEQLTPPVISKMLKDGATADVLAILNLFEQFPLSRRKSLAGPVFTRAFLSSNIDCLHAASVGLLELLVDHNYRPDGDQKRLLGASLLLALLQPVEGLKPERFGTDDDPRLGLAQAGAALFGQDEGLAAALQKVFSQVRHNLKGRDQEDWLNCINEAKGRPKQPLSLDTPSRDFLNKELELRRKSSIPQSTADQIILDRVAGHLRALEVYERREYLEQLLSLPDSNNIDFKRQLIAELRSTNDGALDMLEGSSECAGIIRRLGPPKEPPQTPPKK